MSTVMAWLKNLDTTIIGIGVWAASIGKAIQAAVSPEGEVNWYLLVIGLATGLGLVMSASAKKVAKVEADVAAIRHLKKP